jgi:hypothetical protein
MRPTIVLTVGDVIGLGLLALLALVVLLGCAWIALRNGARRVVARVRAWRAK